MQRFPKWDSGSFTKNEAARAWLKAMKSQTGAANFMNLDWVA